MKSKQYQWRAIATDGQCQQGVLTTADATQAKVILISQGFTQIQLQRQLNLRLWPQGHARLTITQRIQFYRQLALLLDAGIPLHQATQLLIHLLPDPLAQLPEKIYAGIPLSQALHCLYPRWPQVALTLIRLGEQTGQLDHILRALADSEQRTQVIQNQLIQAAFYPTVIIVMALLVGLFFLTMIVPQFARLFSQWSVALPISTQWLLTASQWFINYGLWAISITVISGVALAYWLDPHVLSHLHRSLTYLPGLKRLFLLHDYLQIVYTLRLTYQAGLPLVEGMTLVGDRFAHTIWFHPLRRASELMRQGTQLTAALRQATPLPAPLLHMLHIGEQSGQLTAMLQAAAQWYQEQLTQTIARLTPLLEPCLLFLVGTMVGGFVILLYLPMFQMGQLF